jgi:HEAT repeat protein
VKAVEPLVRLLGDGEVGSLVADDTPVSGFAAEALKGIGEPALPSLRRALGDEKDEEIAKKLTAIIEAIENEGK